MRERKMSNTRKLKILSIAVALLLIGTMSGYAQSKNKNISKALDAAVTRKTAPKAVTSKAPRSHVNIAVKATHVPTSSGVATPRTTPGVAHSTVSTASVTPVHETQFRSPKYVTVGHPLTALLPSAYLYEKGVDLGKVTEYLLNESLDNVATDPLAWDVRKEIHRLCQSALGFTPEFLYTNSTVNDMLDVLSFEQFMLKNEGKFPLTFAQTAAEDGMGEQMTAFLMNRYLLTGEKTMQIADYLWNLYVKAPNGRPVEEIISDVENFVAQQNRLPGVVFFASSEQVAPVIRSAMSMSPEEIALGTEMLLVTHVYSWGWDLPVDLSKRVRVIYNKVEEAKTSWRGNETPNRVATAPNR